MIAALDAEPASPDATARPRMRASLVLRRSPDGFVAKDPAARTYVRLGDQEHFLLLRISEPREAIRGAFEERFGEPLLDEDLSDFETLCARRGLLEGSAAATADDELGDFGEEDEPAGPAAPGVAGAKKRKSFGSLLYFRKSLVDPDEFLTRLEPRLRFVFGRTFLACAAALFVAAGAVFAADPAAPLRDVAASRSWEAAALTVALLLGVTVCHEIGHGLTCKHFGGEVREIGVLMMFGMPCLFCNVSDAWLFERRWQRVAVTMAGTAVDGLVWAVAMLGWRLTVAGSWPNTLACLLMSVTGVRALMNLNPLTRLDGYYALTDLLAVPNLRQVAREQWMSALRRTLWGDAAPAPPRNRAAFAYGAVCWWFYVTAFVASCAGTFRILKGEAGPFETLVLIVLVLFLPKRVFKGLVKREFGRMLRKRPGRAAAWCGAAVLVIAAAFLVPLPNTARGEFAVSPRRKTAAHVELSAFVTAVHVREGEAVEAGQLLAELAVPELTSQIAQKRSELEETTARLHRLEAGARPEEAREQRQRVRRAEQWRDLGRIDLDRAKSAFVQEMLAVAEAVTQGRAEVDLAVASLDRSRRLYERNALPGEQYRSEAGRVEMLRSKLAQAEAQRRQREVEGVRMAEAEAARREQALADEAGKLALLEAGARPEDLEAERAKSARVSEELRQLESRTAKLRVVSPAAGIVVTPRVHERVGEYLPQGAVLAEIEDVRKGVVRIAVPEQDVAGVALGQPVELKVRALPFETFTTRVGRIAPVAAVAQASGSQAGAPAATAGPSVPGTVAVYCEVDNPDAVLRSGMTGYARITRGQRSAAMLLAGKALTYLRTEFWW